MKITPLQQYLILGVLAFLGLSYLYYQFLLKPLNVSIVAKREELRLQTEELENARKIAEKYEEFKKRADTIQRELEWLQSRIPKIIDQANLVESLNLIQNHSGLVFTDFQFQPPVTTNSAYDEVPIRMKINTNYKGLLNFLYQIGISNLFMTVRELVIEPLTDQQNSDYTLSALMTVSGIQAK
jgi:Tfp pilus assembly protein PilO